MAAFALFLLLKRFKNHSSRATKSLRSNAALLCRQANRQMNNICNKRIQATLYKWNKKRSSRCLIVIIVMNNAR